MMASQVLTLLYIAMYTTCIDIVYSNAYYVTVWVIL